MTKKARRALTWGDIYYRGLSKGIDHGWAAYLADQWHKRKFGKYPKDLNQPPGTSRKTY